MTLIKWSVACRICSYRVHLHNARDFWYDDLYHLSELFEWLWRWYWMEERSFNVYRQATVRWWMMTMSLCKRFKEWLDNTKSTCKGSRWYSRIWDDTTRRYECKSCTRPHYIWPYQTRYFSRIHLAKQEHVFGCKISAFNLIPQALSFMKRLILPLVQNKPTIQHPLPSSALVISKISSSSLIKSIILLNATWLSPMHHHQHRRIIGYQLHHSSFLFVIDNTSLPCHHCLLRFFIIVQDGIMKGGKDGLGNVCFGVYNALFFEEEVVVEENDERCNCASCVWYKLLVLVKKNGRFDYACAIMHPLHP